ncbi:MAG: alanine--tRNA ligase [Bacteroidetes bacterium]|jgi:alanyl-tRNA synthetase|nr:alanine--tRNA ligase [Bacteroidota bacterium]
MTANEIRQAFLDFFESKGHKIVPSAPIVLKNDPTLLFTNAGMNQFKDYFLGNQLAPYPRVADTQKCLRASGKHNDLEDVGKDTYHHTMFEMLGNWSFGDYFKNEALTWAWELLSSVYGLDPKRMYATVFEGDGQVPADEDAVNIWKQFLPESHILKCGKKDNFWEMGDQGPCGPCSEIHYDLRSDAERAQVPGHALVNRDNPLVIEIWNNVFIQYNRKADGTLETLPAKHVDTGMGLERLAVVIQGKKSNYDTDVFDYLINFVEIRFGVKYGVNAVNDIAIRVIVDHIRAIVFSIADGQMPSNNGAGYVIRRILRRAVRYAYRHFMANSPFLCDMTFLLADRFADIFPEVKAQAAFISRVIREEETSFLKTLGSGTRRFEQHVTDHPGKDITGDFAFELFDTYGFPIDLTELMAQEANLVVDVQGFKASLDKQRERSRADADKDLGDWIEVHPGMEVLFVGYDMLECQCRMRRYRAMETKGKVQYQLVLDQTPFYPEGGGQVGDSGVLQIDGESVEVVDTKKENELIVHIVNRLPKNLDGVFWARVHADRRRNTERNHSATHLLHAALRRVLGHHVMQKGSLVSPDYLRFDFSHFAKLSSDELEAVERIVNDKIQENILLNEARSLSMAQAKEAGAMMLFGEKYGEVVRMITFDPTYSNELCGGTHVLATGSMGLFKITNETAVAAGIRRIEALTGHKAIAFVDQQIKELGSIKQLLKTNKDTAKAIESLLDDKKHLESKLASFKMDRLRQQAMELAKTGEIMQGMEIVVASAPLEEVSDGKDLAYQIAQLRPEALVVLTAVIQDKPNLWVYVSKGLIAERQIDARNLIKTAAPYIQGGGGGQDFFASAGGKLASGLADAIKAIMEGLLGKV